MPQHQTCPDPAGTSQKGQEWTSTAAGDGIPSFLFEAAGVDDSFTRERVKDVAERLRNLARAIGLLSDEVKSYGKLTTFSNFHWATSPHGGIFRPKVKCGDRIAEGDAVGTYYDLFGDERVVARAPAPGIVLAIHPGPIIPQGDVLIHIGLNPTQA